MFTTRLRSLHKVMSLWISFTLQYRHFLLCLWGSVCTMCSSCIHLENLTRFANCLTVSTFQTLFHYSFTQLISQGQIANLSLIVHHWFHHNQINGIKDKNTWKAEMPLAWFSLMPINKQQENNFVNSPLIHVMFWNTKSINTSQWLLYTMQY